MALQMSLTPLLSLTRKINIVRAWERIRMERSPGRKDCYCENTDVESYISYIFFFFLLFLVLRMRHMEVPRLGFESELQLPAYITATATEDPSCICNLNHSLWQCWIPNPLGEARNWTHILMDIIQVCYCWATTETPIHIILQVVSAKMEKKECI